VLESLANRGAQVDYHDPLVPEISLLGNKLRSSPLPASGDPIYDLAIVLVPQEQVRWESVLTSASVVFDCCNALGKRDPRVVRL
jgi:hypothetical protein